MIPSHFRPLWFQLVEVFLERKWAFCSQSLLRFFMHKKTNFPLISFYLKLFINNFFRMATLMYILYPEYYSYMINQADKSRKTSKCTRFMDCAPFPSSMPTIAWFPATMINIQAAVWHKYTHCTKTLCIKVYDSLDYAWRGVCGCRVTLKPSYAYECIKQLVHNNILNIKRAPCIRIKCAIQL